MENVSGPRVLHIASGDLWAGAEVQLFTLTKTLHNKHGIPVSVVLLNHGKLEQRLSSEGIQVFVIDESKLNGFQILRLLIHIIREYNPDVIHTHRIKENILGSIASMLAGGAPSLRTVHGSPENCPSFRQLPKRILYFLDWLAGRFLQRRIIAVSEDLADLLQKKFPSEKIHVIENGIDLDGISSHEIDHETTLDAMDDTFRIGLAGRLVPVKRADIFIQTARFILDNYPDLKASFHIFGAGPMRDELYALSEELGTDDIVHFEGHCDGMPQKLQELDVLVMTSDHEGLPMILLEAMASQTPVVAHAVGGIPKLLDQGSCGILVYEHNASGYSHELIRLANSQRIRSDIKRNALVRVNARYSSEQNARTYLSEYSGIQKQQQ